MTPDLEDRLRSALDERAMEITPGPPPGGLAGTIRRRRGRRIAGVGALAMAVVAGVVAVVATVPLRALTDPAPALPANPAAPVSTGTVAPLPDGPLAARQDVSAVWTGSQFLVWGGRSVTEDAMNYHADGASYDPTAKTWRKLPASPLSARAGHQAIWTGTEMIVWGGRGTSPEFPDRDGAAYHPGTGRWRTIASNPRDGREWGKPLRVAGKVVIVGGQGSRDRSAGDTVLVYDPATDRWSQFPATHRVHDAVGTPRGTLILAQVDDANHLYLQEVTLAGVARTGPARAPEPFPVSWLGLAISDDTLMLAVTDRPAERARVLTGQLTANGLPTDWSTAQLPTSIQPSVAVDTHHRGLAVALNPDALLLAAMPQVAVVDPRNGDVALQTSPARSDAACGLTGALTWTGTSLFSWGGQTCSPHSGITNTSSGLVWTPSE
ncbi:MAG TPA: hypothetical protein VK453_03260 [Micromonosporaceae bacterium]|nr:hypothetical protein [Micromonosporaceae bacterium]